MAREFRLPDLGEGVHEAEIIQVLVSVGDEVQEDQPILEVETDKAAVEITSPLAGTVTAINTGAGDLATVGDVLITFGEAEGAAEADAEAALNTEAKAILAEAAPPEPAAAPPPAQVVERGPGPVPASPSTRRMARELGVDLQAVPGSGPGGRVTANDVRSFADGAGEVARAAAAPLPGSAGTPTAPSSLPDFDRLGEIERVPLRSVRRATARHMALAWSQIPHVTHQDVADVTRLEDLRQIYRQRIAEQGGSLTLTTFVIKAAAEALRAHPRFNASLDTAREEIVLKKFYNVGLAVDTERGLLVPVVRDVDQKSITQLAIEIKDLVIRTRESKVSREELQGGTFTITNPGSLGGTGFAAIVNYPEVAILGTARSSWQPVARGKGPKAEVVPRYLLPLVLSFDHRVVDGADAARFTNTVIELLEDPGRFLMGV